VYATKDSELIYEQHDKLLREADRRRLVRQLRAARRKGQPQLRASLCSNEARSREGEASFTLRRVGSLARAGGREADLQESSVGKKTIRILIVDDQPAVREGLRLRLSLEPELEVVGEAGDGAEAIALAGSLRPDVVLIDVKMPGTDGIEVTAALKVVVREIAVVMLSLYDDIETRRRAKEAGVAAFVAKHRMEELLAVIRRAAFGRPEGA